MAINEITQATKALPSAFFQMGPIKGESRVEKFRDQIEIKDIDILLQQARSATASTTGGHSAARATFQPIEFVKQVDIASTALLQGCANAQAYGTGTFTLTRQDGASGQHIPYMTIKLMNIVISEVHMRRGMDGLLEEVIKLSFGAIQAEYVVVKPEGGAGGSTKFQYSLVQAKPSFTV